MKKIINRIKHDVTASLYALFAVTVIIGIVAGCFTYLIFKKDIDDEGTYYISGESMEPTLSDGDRISVVDEEAYEKGQIIVFEKPENWRLSSSPKKATIIKRIGGVPGDKISYRGRTIYVNGKGSFDIPETMKCGLKNNWSHVLKKDELFAVGDNAANSVDSRALLCAGYKEKSFIPTSHVKAHGTKFFKEKG